MSSGKIHVMDSMRKPRDTFNKIFDMLNRAWVKFCSNVRGEFKEDLTVRMDFPVIWMKNQLSPMDYINVVQEQRMEFIMDEIVNPSGEFHDNGDLIPRYE